MNPFRDKNRMMRPRWLACVCAFFGSYFWLPCPVCGENFAGFETSGNGVWTSPGGGICVCRKPECNRAARKTWRDAFADGRESYLASHNLERP